MIPTACAAGNYAIAHAVDLLRAGRADVMLGRRRRRLLAHHLHRLPRLGAIAPERCQPFDRNRKGMIPGEGGGRAGAGAAGAGAGARRARSTPRWPATASPATPTT